MDSAFIQQALQAAIDAGCLGEDRPLAAFVDVAGVQRTVAALQAAFPAHFEHAFAAKANPMSKALALVRSSGRL